MSALSSATRFDSYPDDSSFMGEVHPVAGIVCLFGIWLRILLSDPVMGLLDPNYGAVGGSFLTKIHPGVYFILLSFVILLASGGNPLQKWFRIYSAQKIFCLLLIFDTLMFVYWMLRGPVGAGLMIDTHLVVPIAAIVLSYTPRAYCRASIHCFVALAVTNSLIGIAESIGRFRIFTFDPDWPVLKEAQFRSSAFFGHPLNNSTLTSVALLVVLALRYNPLVKVLVLAVFLTSLVAFGGRSGLGFSILSVSIFSLNLVMQARNKLNIQKFFGLMALCIIAPLVLLGGLYAALNSSMGERLMAFSSLNDSSAEARSMVFEAFKYMTTEEMFFGVASDRIEDLAYRIGLAVPMSDIENPWVLMSMHLGLIFFPVWLFLTIAFIRELMRDKTFALKLAVLSYFVTASTFNSFGRKDSIYTIMVAAVVCVYRGFDQKPLSKLIEKDT